MIYANILAAGTGSRMNNSSKPKQFLKINGTPIIIHTLQKFVLFSEIDTIYVSVSKDWIEYTKNLIAKYGVNDEKIKVITGGSERFETINITVEHIKEANGLSDDDVLITHDSVRPFVSHKIINDHIVNSSQYSIMNTIIPAEDTIVEIKDGIVTIPNRAYYNQGQTPQTFVINDYLEKMAALDESVVKELTDVVKIFTYNGAEDLKIFNVSGEKENMKITTPYDLNVANYVVKADHDN